MPSGPYPTNADVFPVVVSAEESDRRKYVFRSNAVRMKILIQPEWSGTDDVLFLFRFRELEPET